MIKRAEGRTRQKKFFEFRHNIKPSIILLIIPLVVGLLSVGLVSSGLYYSELADFGSKRLITENWESARDTLLKVRPDYERKFAYYKVKNGQTLDSIATYFGVDPQKLTLLNPGIIAAGTTIKIPPVEKPLQPIAGANGVLNQAAVFDDSGLLHVKQKYDLRRPVLTTIPELAQFLAKYGAIEQTGPTSYRINKSISLEGDIRLDITKPTVERLELRSSPNDITCLCLDEASVLIDGIEIQSYDPLTKLPDTNTKDGRSFVRMENGRMDILNSKLTHLGNNLIENSKGLAMHSTLLGGGVYGVSWRIPNEQLGVQIATGWVENSEFSHNHFGAYSFSTSGMLWRNNQFTNNVVYGLDTHDDSNNALIEGNTFAYNGGHGLILSERCNYNVVRNNLSARNKLHGYMIHMDSAYNLVEQNTAYGNVDNFVIYQSNYNSIHGNKSYQPQSSHIRISHSSNNNFLTDNQLAAGRRGIYLYDGVNNTYVVNNSMSEVDIKIRTNGAQNTLFADNSIDNINYDIASGDRMIFGRNTIKSQKIEISTPNELLAGSLNN